LPSKHVEWLTFSGNFNTFEEFVGQMFYSLMSSHCIWIEVLNSSSDFSYREPLRLFKYFIKYVLLMLYRTMG
jgi:hypothetical protein